MKHLFIILLAFLLGNPLLAQRIKYKDLFPELAKSSNNEAISKLNAYLIDDLNHPHANLKLALLYENRYKNTDVLRAYEKAMANAEQAKLRFIKAKVTVDEKEVRRNSNYYVQFASSFDNRGRPEISYAVVAKKIQSGYDSAVLLIDKLPPIYKAFTNGVYQYDQAIKIFSEINGTYKSLDELYLLYNQELEDKLNRLKDHYDSTLYYLDKYSALIKAYPINDYKQKYTTHPIITYRLDGLITQSNFLKNQIRLWNYGKWVTDIQSMVDSAIVNLRENIEQNEIALQEGLEKSARKDFQPVVLDKALLFNLNKYDYKSLAASVLEYKQFKQFIINKRFSKPYYDTARNIEKINKYIFYSDLINLTKRADSLIQKAKLRLTEKKFSRHKSFFEKYYKGRSGLEAFISNENKDNTDAFHTYVRTLRNAIIDDLVSDTVTRHKEIRHQNITIPLVVSKVLPDSIDNDLITTQKMENTDGSLYVAGVHRPASDVNNLVAYMARLAPDNTVSWFKTFDVPIDSTVSDANNSISAMVLTQEGCALIIRSEHINTPLAINTFVYLTEAGEAKLIKRLDISDFPRAINYNEGTNSFIISFKGKVLRQNVQHEEALTMMNVNVIGDMLWRRQFTLAGSLEDVVNIRNGYLVVGNFTAIKDDRGNLTRLKVTNAYVLKIDRAGNLVKTLIISSPKTYYISKILKVNDGNINLFGYENKLPEESPVIDYANNLTHIIINDDLSLISSSL